MMHMIMKDFYDLGRAFGMNGGEERCIQGFGGETCRKESTWNN
jgi:hypothetical protein